MSARDPRKLAALAVILALALLAGAFRTRIAADFWPPDRSTVGPNLLAEVVWLAVAFIAAVLLWPPWRRRAHAFIDAKLARLHERHDEQGEHLQRLGHSLADLHRKLDELHPPEPPGGPTMPQPYVVYSYEAGGNPTFRVYGDADTTRGQAQLSAANLQDSARAAGRQVNVMVLAREAMPA